MEIDSIINNIFREIDGYNSGRIEATTYLGDLQIADLRIQSLIREKDVELSRLRDEILSLRKLKSTVNNSDAHARTIQVLQDENSKLKTEINALRVERGSPELISSYKVQIQSLNDRILELEQEKSNLKAELINLRNEYEVRLTVQNFNSQVDIKKSSVTDYNDARASDVSGMRSTEGRNNANMTSPVQKYNINSGISSPKDEGFGIKMVDSKIEPSSTAKTPTYGLTDSRQSGASSSSKEAQGSSYGINPNTVTSTYQTPASSYQSSSVSGNSGVYGATSLSGSGVKYQPYQSGTSNTQNVPTYQAGSSGVYQSGTYQSGTGTGSGVYQAGSGSGVYQAGSGSGVYQSGTSGVSATGGSSGAAYQSGSSYQSGTYQSGTSGTYQAGTTGATGTYQAGNYQPYQSGSSFSSSSGYQAGSYRPSTTGTSGTTGQSSTGQYQSSYKYEKK